MMINHFFDLLSIYRLIVLVDQLNLVISQQENDLMLNVLIFKCLKNDMTLLVSKLFLKAICNARADFLHDLHVRPLGDLGAYLNNMMLIWHLLDLVLSDVLIEHLMVELLWISVNQIVVELASYRLNYIALSWRRAIGELVARVIVNTSIMHDFLVSEGRVLHSDQSHCR